MSSPRLSFCFDVVFAWCVDADWFLGVVRRPGGRRGVWAWSGVTRPWFGWCGVVRRCVPVCVGMVALLYLLEFCVAYEVGKGFVGVGEQLVKISIRFLVRDLGLNSFHVVCVVGFKNKSSIFGVLCVFFDVWLFVLVFCCRGMVGLFSC